jgi:hypothetical protein
MQPMRHAGKFQVGIIDQDVVFNPRDKGRHDQDQ